MYRLVENYSEVWSLLLFVTLLTCPYYTILEIYFYSDCVFHFGIFYCEYKFIIENKNE